MNQTVILAISIPFALASYIPLFASATPSNLLQRLLDREAETRSRLVDGAVAKLKEVQLELEQFFDQWDREVDPFFLQARPKDLRPSVSEYLKLVAMQDRMSRALARVQRLSRIAFWFLVAFAVVMSVAVVLGVLEGLVGPLWGTLAISLGAVLLFAGGGVFIAILLAARVVDGAHWTAHQLESAAQTGFSTEAS